MLNAVRIISTDEKGLFVIFKQSVMNQITPAEKNITLHVFIIAIPRNKVNKVIIGNSDRKDGIDFGSGHGSCVEGVGGQRAGGVRFGSAFAFVGTVLKQQLIDGETILRNKERNIAFFVHETLISSYES